MRTGDWLEAVTAAAREGRIKGLTVAVATALAMHANAEGECWPSRQRIAASAGVSVRTVESSALPALEAAGLVRITRSPGRRSNVYQLTNGAGAALLNGAGAALLQRATAQEVRSNGAGAAPEPPKEPPVEKTRARNSRPKAATAHRKRPLRVPYQPPLLNPLPTPEPDPERGYSITVTADEALAHHLAVRGYTLERPPGRRGVRGTVAVGQ